MSDNSTDTSSNAAFDLAQSTTTATFLTSLAINSVLALVQFLGWIILRRLIRAVYEPRTYIPPKDQQATPLGRNLLQPIWRIMMSDSKDILNKNGVDPYVFVRFIRMLAVALVPIWALSWVVLMCVNSISPTAGLSGLDRFQFGNIASSQQSRYWSHLILVYIFDLWFMFLIWREMAHWLDIRQSYLVDPKHANLAQASTVLITGVPHHLMDERSLAQLFAHLPGGIKRIWLTRNIKDMPEVYERRTKACNILEKAQVKLIKTAVQKNQTTDLVRPITRLKPSWAPFGLGWLGIGEKVDAIDWARKEIAESTAMLAAGRSQIARDIQSPGAEADEYAPLSSAFIQFNMQIAAHMARQCLTYSVPYKMNRRFIEQSPSNVIWKNMRLSDYSVRIRRSIGFLVFIGILIGWSPVSAFIGALSNITAVTTHYKWLRWLNGEGFGKRLLQGVATGILPPILSALSSLLFPILFRKMSVLQGTVSRTEVELEVMDRFFTFLVVHSFLIITLASGIIASIQPIIENPTNVAKELARNLPKASTFFVSRLLLQFTGRASTLLQPISFFIYYGRVIAGAGTPRGIFNKRYRMPTVDYGTEFPLMTVYVCILLAYMVIAPVINGFGAAFALLSYVVFKYLFIWVVDQPPQRDTGGEFFPKAITHLFTGLYIQQVCLCVLFFLARDIQGRASCLPQGSLMVVLIVVTIGIQLLVRSAYYPLKVALPLSMGHLSGKDTTPAAIGMHWDEKALRWAAIPLSPHGTEVPPVSPVCKDADDEDEEDQPSAESELEQVDAQESPIELAHSRSPSNAQEKSTASIELADMSRSGSSTRNLTEEFDDQDAEQYFALPGGPGVRMAKIDDANDPAAFLHPATKNPQRIVWLPVDELGVGAEQVKGNRSHGVKSSTRFATMTSKGKVRINGPPPDTVD